MTVNKKFSEVLNDNIKENSKKIIKTLTEEAASDFHPTPLKTYEDHYMQSKKRYENSFDKYKEMINMAFQLLFEKGVFQRKQIDEQKILQLYEIFKNSENLSSIPTSNRDYLGLTEQNLFDAYDVGFEFYNEANYKQAVGIFSLLTILDPLIPAYWYAIGLSEHQAKNYDNAILAYRYTLILKPDTLDALTNACSCFESAGKIQEGIHFLSELSDAVHHIEDPELVESIMQKVKEYQKHWDNQI